MQNFENELHFFPVSVFRKKLQGALFTIFEREVGVNSSNDLFLTP